MPSATGSAPPEKPVPAPRATNGMPSSLQIRTTACTSSVESRQRDERRNDAAAGEPVALVRPQLLRLADRPRDRGEAVERTRSHCPRVYVVLRLDRWTSPPVHAPHRACPPDDLHALPDSREAVPGRRAVPRRDPVDRRPALPRGGARGGRAARRARAPRLAGIGRLHADRRRARRAGAPRRGRAGRGQASSRARTPPGALSATARAHAGFAATAHGQEQVAANLEDCVRAAEHGFRSVLIADLGVLSLFGAARRDGLLPADMQAKVSVMLPAANAASARVLERLGASTINLPTDLTLPRSQRSAQPSTSRSTSTSRRRTTSAASCAITRSRS